MAEPQVPDRETRERLLGALADLIAHGGPEPFLRAPVVPGAKAFPEPWAPTRAGVALLLRRLATYAGLDTAAAREGMPASERAIRLDDQRFAKAPPTERMPATRVEFRRITREDIELAVGLVGTDDVVGTLAH